MKGYQVLLFILFDDCFQNKLKNIFFLIKSKCKITTIENIDLYEFNDKRIDYE